MRAVVQRVSSASVSVDGQVISQISRGLMVLVGIGRDDTESDVSILTNKILCLRVFSDPADSAKMWKTKDIDGDILCVSQFTLLAETRKGNKPDFHNAMPTEQSRELYATILEALRQAYGKSEKVQDGRFGAMMNVSLTNEGPVTFTLDSRKFEYTPEQGLGSTKNSKSQSKP
ncbi:D-Tyr tRNAtyr deacylase-like domain-containing protein [Mycena albidolilacea]|uniref:D-aminoacyl-tRNA deacylase n=1 Tax=Mycena albidolilacea TaxID=1033008 RepID=A0AAD7ADS5_9AGAR|nr:D-Tyr tRNAtyr deacylase-like domain-containing protein [Mycena albidolilacea]